MSTSDSVNESGRRDECQSQTGGREGGRRGEGTACMQGTYWIEFTWRSTSAQSSAGVRGERQQYFIVVLKQLSLRWNLTCENDLTYPVAADVSYGGLKPPKLIIKLKCPNNNFKNTLLAWIEKSNVTDMDTFDLLLYSFLFVFIRQLFYFFIWFIHFLPV